MAVAVIISFVYNVDDTQIFRLQMLIDPQRKQVNILAVIGHSQNILRHKDDNIRKLYEKLLVFFRLLLVIWTVLLTMLILQSPSSSTSWFSNNKGNIKKSIHM